MTLRISNIRRAVTEPESDLPHVLTARLGVREQDMLRWRIVRKSLDARSRLRLDFVYSVAVDLAKDSERFVRERTMPDVAEYVADRFEEPEQGDQTLEHRPVIVGTGPAGLVAGYYLALRG